MAISRKIPRPIYPAVIRGKNRVNFDALNKASSLSHIFFRFDHNDIIKRRIISIVPKNSIIVQPFIIRVLEAFNGSVTPILRVGTVPIDPDATTLEIRSIGSFEVATVRVGELHPNNLISGNFLQLLKQDREVTIVVEDFGSTQSTQGRGWGLMQYITLDPGS